VNRTVSRMTTSTLARAGAVLTLAALGIAEIGPAPADARPPRPGAHTCLLGTVGGSSNTGGLTVSDGTEIEITITDSRGNVGKARYVCDNGKWVQIRRFAGGLDGTVLANGQVATAAIRSGSKPLTVSLRRSTLGAIIGTTTQVTSHSV
jgi:hypothetical protein